MVTEKYFLCGSMLQKFIPKGINFFYVCGGRGIGKTYSALDFCLKLYNNEIVLDPSLEHQKFIYLRRTVVQARASSMPSTNPFKKYNSNEGTSICADFNSTYGYGEFYADSEKKDTIGYACALSTFQNLRGVDYSDVVFILYDECLTEDGSSTRFRNEGNTLMNLYETVNRNRVLEGRPEVILLLLSNPIDLASDLLSQLNFTKIIGSMVLKGQQRYTDYDRSLHIERLKDHAISKEKEKGALYKFAPKSFSEQSLSGEFTENDLSLIETPKLQDYLPLISIEIVTIYRHKSEEKYHISSSIQPATYNLQLAEKELLRDMFYFKYKILVVNRIVTYNSFQTKMVFENLIRYKQPT